MDRKRLTQRFPFLLPMRRAQRKMCFYAGMRFDGCRYAQTIGEKSLSHLLFETDCALYNHNTGFDMIYQENKVFNLKLAAKTLNGLLIRPGETFSFWLFLHTPLTIIQRRGHEVKEFPEPNSDEIKGVDATISEGWIDLKVRNDTDCTYQIWVTLDDEKIIGQVFADKEPQALYKITNGSIQYVRESGGIYEYAPGKRMQVALGTGEIIDCKLLYTNKCKICYPLPESVDIQEENQ
ncbi:TPA: VanW family protein [Enterococcus faecium]|nr:VanW family protein [Enterococcus faecium]HCI1216247.1 VanW family protein [Enterococcus faecium]HCI1314374.1 VanW family protein [Enterococcus faecium]HCI1479881.1 VanW family protein [Enterococcus faecium]HCI1588750.1 VanW family protein [Enterococcus faecium]